VNVSSYTLYTVLLHYTLYAYTIHYTPTLYTVLIHYTLYAYAIHYTHTLQVSTLSTHLEGVDRKRATYAGYCVAVHANAAAERYTCEDIVDTGRAGETREDRRASETREDRRASETGEGQEASMSGATSLSGAAEGAAAMPPPIHLPYATGKETEQEAEKEAEQDDWHDDGCAAEYYLDANADLLVPLFIGSRTSLYSRILDVWWGHVPHVPHAAHIANELRQHYVSSGKAAGMKCSPCPAGKRPKKRAPNWWMRGAGADPKRGAGVDWRRSSLVPAAVAPISPWPATPRWPQEAQ
jgi:hypothetical protein